MPKIKVAKASNKKPMKHEKRNGHALPSTIRWLEVYKQTWCRFLATWEVQLPLVIM